jgi:Zn-dependent protease
LGHAIAMRHLLGADVDIAVGSVGRLVDLQLGQTQIRIHALIDPRKLSGSALTNARRVTAADALLISVAGPVASFVGACFTSSLLAATESGTLPHGLLWAATFGGIFGVLNLVPVSLTEGRGGRVIRTDGRLALDAIGAMRIARSR